MKQYHNIPPLNSAPEQKTDEPKVSCWSVVYIKAGERRTALVGSSSPEEIPTWLKTANGGIEVIVQEANAIELFTMAPGKVHHDRPYDPKNYSRQTL